jgi:hypothetical protein
LLARLYAQSGVRPWNAVWETGRAASLRQRYFKRTSTSELRPGDDRELALISLVLVAGDGGVLAFGQHDGGERADAFGDHVAARGQNGPGRIGDGLAACLGTPA